MSIAGLEPRWAGHEGDDGRSSKRLAREFLFAFHAALRALKLYPLENQAVQNALVELHRVAAALSRREQGVALRYVGEFCFVNDLRLRIDLSSYATFGAVGRSLRRHGVGSLEAGPAATPRDWTTVLALLLGEPHPTDPFGELCRHLSAAGVRQIEVHATGDSGPEPSADDRSHESAKQTYVHSVAVARDAMQGLRMGRGVSVRRVKRTVQRIVDQVLTNEVSIVGMTVLRGHDEYTFVHAVNVCIFSIALGRKLGLSKSELFELGFGALMHDIGKIRMPIEVITKNGPLSEAEWDLMREHPTEGLLELLGINSGRDVSMRAMLIAYEHHMRTDGAGYPRSLRPRDPTLFSRIVAVADGFEAATSQRSYQSTPATPEAVLREMRDNAARGYDPLLVKALISVTGFYPVGCLVILDSFELAVVIGPGSGPDGIHQPLVRVVYDERGMPVLPPRAVDLGEVDPATGAPKRTIIKITDPERYGIHVQDYFA